MSNSSRPQTIDNSAVAHTSLLPAMNSIWEKALPLARERLYPQGFYLMLRDEARRDFYYLASGSLAIMYHAPSGRARNMLSLKAGNLFNISLAAGSLFMPDRKASSQFYCLEEARIWRFPGGLLHDEAFIRAYPELISNLLASLGLRLLITHDTLSSVGTNRLPARIAEFILQLSRANGDADEFSPGISQEDLANLLGVHRVTLLRALAKMKKSKLLVSFTHSRLVIGDREALRRMTDS